MNTSSDDKPVGSVAPFRAEKESRGENWFRNLIAVGALVAASVYGTWLVARGPLGLLGRWTDGFETTANPQELADHRRGGEQGWFDWLPQQGGLRQVVWNQPQSLGDTLGGSAWEADSALSSDGRWLVYAVGQEGQDRDLWIAEVVGLGETEELRAPANPRPLSSLNSLGDDATPAFVGDWLWFASDREGGAGGLDLWRIRFDAQSGVARGEAQLAPAGINSSADDSDPTFDKSGSLLVFATNRIHLPETSLGRGWDLYSAQLPGVAGPSESMSIAGPVLALDTLNTAGDERDPALSAEGVALYYAHRPYQGKPGQKKSGQGKQASAPNTRKGIQQGQRPELPSKDSLASLWTRPAPGADFDLVRAVRLNGDWLHPEVLKALDTGQDERGPTPTGDGFGLLFSSCEADTSQSEAEGELALDSNFFFASSTELFRIPRPIRWADWAILATLLLLALCAWLGRRWEQLDVLYRCLLASLLVHLAMLWWFRSVHPEPEAPELPVQEGPTFRVQLDSIVEARRQEQRNNTERSGELNDLARESVEQLAANSAEIAQPQRVQSEAPADSLELTTQHSPAPLSTSDPASAPERISRESVAVESANSASESASSDLELQSPSESLQRYSGEEVAQASPEPQQTSVSRGERTAGPAGESAKPSRRPSASAPTEALLSDSGASGLRAEISVSERQGLTNDALRPGRQSSDVTRASDYTGREAAVAVALPESEGGFGDQSSEEASGAQAGLQTAEPQDFAGLRSGSNSPSEVGGGGPSRRAGRSASGSALEVRPTLKRGPLSSAARGSSAPSARGDRPVVSRKSGAVQRPAASQGLTRNSVALNAPQADSESGKPEQSGLSQDSSSSAAAPGLAAMVPSSGPRSFKRSSARREGAADQSSSSVSPKGWDSDGAGPSRLGLISMSRSGADSSRSSNRAGSSEALAPSRKSDDRPRAGSSVAKQERNFRPERDPIAAPLDPFGARSGEQKQRALDEFGGNETTELAVARGLAYLASRQRTNGRADDPNRGAIGDPDFVSSKYRRTVVGRTGLALLAFLGAGHEPGGDGEYSEVASRAADFLLRSQDRRTGHFGNTGPYGHGIATYALAECFAITGEERLRQPLLSAIERIVDTQFEGRGVLDGGWGYYYADGGRFDNWPRASVTAWQVMALCSARIGKLPVPENTLARAQRFLERSFEEQSGWFRYSHDPERLNGDPPTLPGSTPAALFALALLGSDTSDRNLGGAWEFLTRRPPSRYRARSDDHFVHAGEGNLYFWYYGTLALFRRGGDAWKRWNVAMQETLLDEQRRNGSWAPLSVYAREYAGDTNQDAVYSTAMCVLTLEVYYRYVTPLLDQESQQER